VVIDAGPDEISGTLPPEVPFVGAVDDGVATGCEVGCPLPGILLVVQPKTAIAAASVVLASKSFLLTTLRIGPPVFSQRVVTGYLEQVTCRGRELKAGYIHCYHVLP
jgi:hypothetical protein